MLEPATPGLWCDASTKLSFAQALALKSAGYVGVFRYVPLPGVNAAADIDAGELAMLLDVGLEVGLVQHVRFADPGLGGWSPPAHSGQMDASRAIAMARAAGYPSGAHLWCDWEDVAPSCTVADAQKFLNDWAETVTDSAYRAGLYVGFHSPSRPSNCTSFTGSIATGPTRPSSRRDAGRGHLAGAGDYRRGRAHRHGPSRAGPPRRPAICVCR